MRFTKILFFVLLCHSISVSAQTIELLSISEISFDGQIEKTNESVLLDIIQFKVGDPVSIDQIKKNLQELINFPGIGSGDYQVDTIRNQLSLSYKLNEIRTFLPILNFGGIKGNVWYQLGFKDINWLGRGNQLTAFYQNSDGRHSGQLYYRVPKILNSKWGYSLSLSRWASEEPLYFPDGVSVQYNYDFNNVGFTGIYGFDVNRRIEFGASYFVEKYNKLNEIIGGEILPGPDFLSQDKVLARLNYAEDFIDYFSFQQEGIAWQGLYQYVHTLKEDFAFNSLILQARYYKMFERKFNLAIRSRFGISTNNESPFAPFVVDSHVNLRGVGNRIDRGTAQLILNVELRRTLHDKGSWASQLVVFTDAGSWRTPGGSFKEIFESEQFRQFVGGGFRLVYKKIYGAVLRVDFGVDIYNTKENGLVIGFGQYY